MVASVANTVVYLLASALWVIPAGVEIPKTGGPLPLGVVIGFSFVPVLLAAAFLAVLGRVTRRPVRTFTVVAVVLSLYTPFSIPGAPLSMILALELSTL